jgi:hypothetical protein
MAAMRPIALALVAVLGLPATASAGPLAKALDHLASRQDRAGGGLAIGGGTDPVYTAWGAIAVAAAGEDPAAWRRGPASLAGALARPLRRPLLGDIERTAVAAAAAGLDPRDVGGRNLVRDVLRAQDADGTIGGDPFTTAWGILALRAASLPPGSRAIRLAVAALERTQRGDGGWSLASKAPGSSPNTTSAAIQALVAAGRDPRRSPALRRARAFLGRAQNPDGGFPPIAGGQSDALTTAWVVVALHALGLRPADPPWSWGGGPLGLLRRRQGADGGVRNAALSEAPSVWATAEAALALSGRWLPVAHPLGRRARRAPWAVWRTPRAGGRVQGPLVVRYRDDPGGTGVDPDRVRLVVAGVDVTSRAIVTSVAVQLAATAVPPGSVPVSLLIADRAGNARILRWRVVGRGR